MNKKISAMALTAAIVCTSASAFAAANPFADVPRDHWAYDAVAELADEGVIEGYGDGTYSGENEITRYEMAQMVAKAMAKEDQVNAQQKALIDRLAAEFSAELNNLGVRVANLEDRIDNVKWGGEMRYTASKRMFHDGPDSSMNRLELRLKPVATVNDHWLVRARIDGRADMAADTSTTLQLKQANVEGHYGAWTIEAGMFPVWTEQGVILDDNISGGQVTYAGDKVTAGTLNAASPLIIRADSVGGDTRLSHIARLLDTPLQTLSGGETQRLLLARAMLRHPDLIVLDEPAAGIDPVALGDYYQTIRDWQRAHRIAILMVSHDLHLVMAASDHILCLNRHICCHGSPESIIGNPEFLPLLGDDARHPEAIGVYTHHHDHSHL